MCSWRRPWDTCQEVPIIEDEQTPWKMIKLLKFITLCVVAGIVFGLALCSKVCYFLYMYNMTTARNIGELTLDTCDFFSKCVLYRQKWVTLFGEEILAPRYHGSYLLSLVKSNYHRRITWSYLTYSHFSLFFRLLSSSSSPCPTKAHRQSQTSRSRLFCCV